MCVYKYTSGEGMNEEKKLIAFCLTPLAEALLSRISSNRNQKKGVGENFLQKHSSDMLGL